MAYIQAKDVPLYFSSAIDSRSTQPTETPDNANRAVFANQVQLNYTPNIAPTRLVGRNVTNDSFLLAGPPNATLSFSAYVCPNGADAQNAEFNIVNYTGQKTHGARFKIGDGANGLQGSGAYLTSYSMTVTPYAPVVFQADFAIYNPLTTTSEGGFIANANQSSVLDRKIFC